MKVKTLYFVTEKLVKLMDVDIDEKTGTASVGKKKQFNFDKSKPLSIETGGKLRKTLKPFYVLKHDIHKPLDVNFQKDKEKNKTAAHMVVTPENFKNMMTQGTLSTLLTLSPPTASQMLLWIGMGGVMGFLLGLVIPFG